MVESHLVSAALQSVRPLCMELVQAPSSRCVKALAVQLKSFDAEVMQELQQFLVFAIRSTLVACINKSLSQELLIETCGVADIVLSKSRLQHVGLFMDLFSILSDLLLSCGAKDKNCWWQHGNRFAGLLPGMSTAMLKVLMGDSKQGHQLLCKALEVWTEVVCLTLADESLAQEQKEGHAWIDELKMEGRLKELIFRRDDPWIKGVVPRVEFMVKEVSKVKKHDNWKVRRQLVVWAEQLLVACGQSLQSCVSPLLEVLVLLMTDSYSQVAAPAASALQRYRDKQGSLDGSRKLMEILKEDLFALLTSLPRRIKMEDEEEKCAVAGLLVSYITQIGKDMSSLLLSQAHVSRLVRVLVQVLELDVADQKILEESGMGAHGTTNLGKFIQQARVMMPRKVFAHFRDDKVKSGLLKACRLLGYFGELSVLVEGFLEAYRESAAHQLSCVLIISEILAGHGERRSAEEGAHTTEGGCEEIVRLLLDEFLSDENMRICDCQHSPMQSTQTTSLSSSSKVSLYVMGDDDTGVDKIIMTRNRTIMLTCLYLEGVAVCAKVVGERFRLMLMDVLYPVAEKVGNEVSAISGSAYLTLCSIAEACGYESVDELIQSNADYLVTSISLRLRHFGRHHRTPSVLSVMLQLCSTNILPLVWDSILQILDTLDEHHADQVVIFLPVLHHLTLAVARWFPPQNKKKSIQQPPPPKKLDPQDVKQFLLDRRQHRMEAEAYDAEPEEEDAATIEEHLTKMAEEKHLQMGEGEEKEEGEVEEKDKEPPLHVKAVKEVLLRAKHIVSSCDPRLTLLALDVIGQGCYDLTDYENDLLPIVHQLWSSFKQRFYDGEKLVVIKAVKTLQRLCECCGDFIRQRVEKDVLPSMKGFLERQVSASAGKGSSYQYTVNYKLQIAWLTSLGDMALMLCLDGSALEEVVQCCLPYLSQHQPSKLQQACMGCVKQLMACDRDVVWLALMGLYAPALPSPPSPFFKPITVFKGVGETNEFSTSVTQLLQHLEDY